MFSSITFDTLGLKVYVGRKTGKASVLTTADPCEMVGMMIRQPDGRVEWKPRNCAGLPGDVYNVVKTMWAPILEVVPLPNSEVYQGVSSIRFENLGMVVLVWRSMQSAYLLTLDGDEVGVMDRLTSGRLEWTPVAHGAKLPVEVLDVVATMI